MNDDELYREFHLRHFGALLGYARKAAYFDEHDAEDGVLTSLGDKWQQILDHLRSEGVEVVPRWLWNNIRCDVIDIRKKRLGLGRGKVVRTVVTAPEDLATLPEADSSISRVDVSKWEAALEHAFKHCRPPITETEKNVLRLTELQQPPLSESEAAAHLGTTENVIKVRRYSGKQKLRNFLNPGGQGRPEKLL